MPDYNEGKIYKIVCNTTGLCYIGSTAQKRLCDRLTGHKRHYTSYYKHGIRSYLTSFQVLESDDYDCILVEEYPCDNKMQLEQRERYYIDSMPCVNKHIPTRSQQEYQEDNKEKIADYKKEWSEINKDKLKEQHKIYNEENKVIIAQKSKEHRELNKDKISAQRKEKYLKDPEKAKARAKAWRIANPEQEKLSGKKYCEEHKDKIRDYKAEWAKQNRASKTEEEKEAVRARKREWCEKNKDKINLQQKAGRAKKKAELAINI